MPGIMDILKKIYNVLTQTKRGNEDSLNYDGGFAYLPKDKQINAGLKKINDVLKNPELEKKEKLKKKKF